MHKILKEEKLNFEGMNAFEIRENNLNLYDSFFAIYNKGFVRFSTNNCFDKIFPSMRDVENVEIHDMGNPYANSFESKDLKLLN